MPFPQNTEIDKQKNNRSAVGLTLLSGAIASIVVLPLVWILLMVLQINLISALNNILSFRTLQVVFNSILIVILVTLLSTIIAVPLAYLTVRTNLPFSRFWTVAISMPLVIPSYIGAFAFVSAFGPNGELQSLLSPVGINSLPPIYGLYGTVLVLTLYTYPYVYLSTRASLKTMDEKLINAARTLNHSRLKAFYKVILPQIRPAIAAGALLVALYTISDFGTPAIMRFDVFTRVIYINRFDLDFSALLSLQLILATVVILALEHRIRGQKVQSTSDTKPNKLELGRLKWIATFFCSIVTGLALVIPTSILILWLLRNNIAGNSSVSQLSYILNSIGVSAVTALIAAILCLPVSYLAVRHKSKISEIIVQTTYIGFAIPGIVIGLAVVFFGARYLTPLYQTLPLLVFAYVVRFLPQAIGSTRSTLLQIDPKIEHASRVLGRSQVETFKEVTFPLIIPGVLAGAALVFLTTMKELPATLLLRPTSFDTLVTRIWTAEHAGYFGEAAIPAIILVFVSSISMFILLSQERYENI